MKTSQRVVLHAEAVARRCFLKQAFLKISQISQKNTFVKSLSINRIAGLMPAILLKTRLPQVFRRELYEILKNLFYRTPTAPVSIHSGTVVVNEYIHTFCTYFSISKFQMLSFARNKKYTSFMLKLKTKELPFEGAENLMSTQSKSNIN